MKGSIIQLANGTLKRVEDLETEDFVQSAEISKDLKVDSSTVVRIEEQPERGAAMLSFSVGKHKVQVTVEATLEHPFFVFGQGWSSCSVSRTLARYGLDCQKLSVGDVCISLTHKDVNLKAAEISQQQQQLQQKHEDEEQLSSQSSSQAGGKADISSSSVSPVSSSAWLHSHPPTVTSAAASFLPPSSSSSSSSSPSAMKAENPSSPFPAPANSSSLRRSSQSELPPPSCNIVPVKKESNSSQHGSLSQRRDSHNGEEDHSKQEEVDDSKEEAEGSTSALHERRWSASEAVASKAEQEQRLWAKEAQPREEAGSLSGGESSMQQ